KRDCEPIVWNREIIRHAQRNDPSLAEIISEVSQGNNGDYFLDDDGVLYKKTTETRHADRLVIPEGLKIEERHHRIVNQLRWSRRTQPKDNSNVSLWMLSGH
ncbi:hypothetical protein CBL_21219, partial [Carabus blaptoides fortunei]